MGELGTTPEALEGNLQDILDLCVPWGALVLIDEAEMLWSVAPSPTSSATRWSA